MKAFQTKLGIAIESNVILNPSVIALIERKYSQHFELAALFAFHSVARYLRVN